jgi:Zn-dependent peptidase ImmA (M78 family)/DNA-binding XRE family transcriptional regulator
MREGSRVMVENMAINQSLDPRMVGRRIAEARKARGRTQEEVADFLECSRPTYIAIEKGERAAKPDEVIRLAKFFDRTVNELVRPTEPVIDLQPHLRAAVPKKMKGTEQDELNGAIDALQRLAEDYRDLEVLMNAPLRTNYPDGISLDSRIDPRELAETTAVRERQRLGLGDQPVIYLRRVLEWDVGLRIFYGDLPSIIAGMYAYTTDLGCCIFINHKHPAERRRVSMLHEYGHLMVDRHTPGIDYLKTPGRKRENERFAEAFALSFLMPASSLRQRFHDIVTTTGDFRVADLSRLSHLYYVSHTAMALRLGELGLIPRGSWEALKESRYSPREAKKYLGLPPQPVNDERFPERYQYLAVAACQAGELGESDLAYYLRCDIVKAREIMERTLTSREVEATGEESLWRLDDFTRSLLGTTA